MEEEEEGREGSGSGSGGGGAVFFRGCFFGRRSTAAAAAAEAVGRKSLRLGCECQAGESSPPRAVGDDVQWPSTPRVVVVVVSSCPLSSSFANPAETARAAANGTPAAVLAMINLHAPFVPRHFEVAEAAPLCGARSPLSSPKCCHWVTQTNQWRRPSSTRLLTEDALLSLRKGWDCIRLSLSVSSFCLFKMTLLMTADPSPPFKAGSNPASSVSLLSCLAKRRRGGVRNMYSTVHRTRTERRRRLRLRLHRRRRHRPTNRLARFLAPLPRSPSPASSFRCSLSVCISRCCCLFLALSLSLSLHAQCPPESPVPRAGGVASSSARPLARPPRVQCLALWGVMA